VTEVSSNRLSLIDPEFSAFLRQRTDLELRSVALAACQFALERTGLRDPLINTGLEALTNHNYGDLLLRSKVEVLVESLDEVQWNLQDAMKEGKANRIDYEAAFQQARAAHTLYFALDSDAFLAAIDSLYEANAATGNPSKLSTDLRKVILENLSN